MVTHDGEGEQLPAVAIDGPKHRLDEESLGRFGGENRRSKFGAVIDVVNALVGKVTSPAGHRVYIGQTSL